MTSRMKWAKVYILIFIFAFQTHDELIITWYLNVCIVLCVSSNQNDFLCNIFMLCCVSTMSNSFQMRFFQTTVIFLLPELSYLITNNAVIGATMRVIMILLIFLYVCIVHMSLLAIFMIAPGDWKKVPIINNHISCCWLIIEKIGLIIAKLILEVASLLRYHSNCHRFATLRN